MSVAALPLRRLGRGDAAIFFVLGLALWLLNHPYQGIWHDARIYGLIAARWLHADALAPDLFFRFGSQGDLSLFTPLFGTLVGWLGLDRSALLVALSGGMLWMAAGAVLALRTLGTGFGARFAFLLGAVAMVSYSPNSSTFEIGESFATARSWAVPFGLAAVAALTAGRQWWSLGLAVCATLLHPLLGIWAIALWTLVRFSARHAALLVLAGLSGVVLLGLANFDIPHLRLMDGAWLAMARDQAPDIVFKSLAQSRLPQYGAVLIALWLGARAGTESNRPLYLRALLLGAGGLAIALLASHVLPVEILVQGQPWRVMALLLPLAAVAAIDALQCVWRASPNRMGWMLLAALVVTLGISVWLPALGLLAVAVLAPRVWWQGLDAWLAGRRILFGVALALPWFALLPGIVADWDVAGSRMLNPWWQGAEWLHGLLTGQLWQGAALLALASLWLPRRVSGSALVLGGVLVIAVLAATVTHWDRRPDVTRQEEQCYLAPRCSPHPFKAFVAPGQTVYWPGRELRVWFRLHRASYFGDIQRTGFVFSRAKFEEAMRREAWVAAGQDPLHLCADPILDWVVSAKPEAAKPPRADHSGLGLYACADFRAVPPAPTSVQPRL